MVMHTVLIIFFDVWDDLKQPFLGSNSHK